MHNGGVSDEFIRALAEYRAGHAPAAELDTDAVDAWLGQEPDHVEEIALAEALLGQLLVCPMDAIPTDRQPNVADAGDEWLLVDERALVNPEGWR